MEKQVLKKIKRRYIKRAVEYSMLFDLKEKS